jgi:hypothetical protein
VDPDSANEPIEDTILIGSSMPLSGGPAASAFAPFADGLNAYVDDKDTTRAERITRPGSRLTR